MLRTRCGSAGVSQRSVQAAGQRVCRKYRNAYIRKLQQREYDKLLNIVPSLANNVHRQRIAKVTVIEETIRYIDELHEALAERTRQETGGLVKVSTQTAAKAAQEVFVHQVVQHLINSNTSKESSDHPLSEDSRNSSSHLKESCDYAHPEDSCDHQHPTHSGDSSHPNVVPDHTHPENSGESLHPKESCDYSHPIKRSHQTHCEDSSGCPHPIVDYDRACPSLDPSDDLESRTRSGGGSSGQAADSNSNTDSSSVSRDNVCWTDSSNHGNIVPGVCAVACSDVIDSLRIETTQDVESHINSALNL